MLLPADGLNIPPIFHTMSRDPQGTKNGTFMDIFSEYGYQETLG